MIKASTLRATAAGTPQEQQRQPQQQQQQQQPAASWQEPRGWAAQAADVTCGLPQQESYKSLAVFAEVRLAEALERVSKTCPDTVDEEGQPLPNSLRTAVCCQLLGELGALAGPFSGPLLKLRELLLPAIYSSYASASQATATASSSSSLQFDQLPWSAVAARLRADNAALLAQQDVFKQQLRHHQAQMALVEQQLLSFRDALDAGQAAAAELQRTNAGLAAARDAAAEEAAASAEESKRLTLELARLKEELCEAQDRLADSRDAAAQEQEQWGRQLAVLHKQLHVEVQEREAAVALAAARLTLAEGQELEARCQEAERRAEELEQQLTALQAASRAAQQQQQLLTPRPTEWGPAQALAAKCNATSETVQQLLQQHAATLALLQRQQRLLQAAAAPDAAPQPWQLALRAESLSSFITEGAGLPGCCGDSSSDGGSSRSGQGVSESEGPASREQQPRLSAAPLGLSPHVPRFLRWDEVVPLREQSLQGLQQQLADVLCGHALHEALHGRCQLHVYLAHHFSVVAANSSSGGASDASAPTAAAAAAAEAADRRADAAEAAANAAIAGAGAAAAAGYAFYHALCSHRHSDVRVDAVWHVLTGQAPQALLQEQRRQAAQLVAVLAELHAALKAAQPLRRSSSSSDEGEGGGTSRDGATAGPHCTAADVAELLCAMFSEKPAEQLDELGACLVDACAAAGSSGSGESSSRSAAAVTAESIGALLQQMQYGWWAEAHAAGEERCQQLQPAGSPAHLLLDCLLRQHLHGVVAQLDRAAATVQQCWVAAAAAATGSGRVWWDELADALAPPEASSSSSGGSSRGNHGGTRRHSAVGDLSLTAAAARMAGGRGGHASSEAGAGADAGTGGTSSMRGWLAAARHAAGGNAAVSPMQLAAWLRRDCLLQPRGCESDVAAAAQWCAAVLRPRLAAAGDGGGA